MSLEVVTWIDEKNQESILDVFPNPTTETLYVKTNTQVDQATILIVNSLGQLIHKQVADQAEFRNIIDVRSLSPGVYQVVWNSSQGSFSKSFIKQ